MKLTLAIVCSLLLAGTPFVSAQAQTACVDVARAAHAACHCGMPCCGAPVSSNSQPAPAAPAPGSNQTQLLPLAPAALVWILPAAPASEISTAIPSLLKANRTPLFARNCAFLI
ncbi:MAG TPA: hypothetical protein VFY06_14530 [Verrucomicrobiae bacterium]|nr:hypothetical protein [Verrucomicrobiae bacterium]